MSSIADEWFLRLTACNTNSEYGDKEFSLRQLLVACPSTDPAKDDVSEAQRAERLRLVDGGVILGRGGGAAPTKHKGDIAWPIVSRSHAQLNVSPRGHVYLTDLGSRHGTMIRPNCSLLEELPISLSRLSPVQLCDQDVIALGKHVSSMIKYEPVLYRVSFRYPHLGSKSSKGGKRTLLGKITPNIARSRFANADNLHSLGKAIGEIKDPKLDLTQGLGHVSPKEIDPSTVMGHGQSAVDHEDGPPDVEPIVVVKKDVTMSISSLVESPLSPSGVYRVPESVLYQSDVEADLPRGTGELGGSPAPGDGDDYQRRSDSPRPAEDDIGPTASVDGSVVVFDFASPSNVADGPAEAAHVDSDHTEPASSPFVIQDLLQAEMNAAMIVAERMAREDIPLPPAPRPSHAVVMNPTDYPLPPPRTPSHNNYLRRSSDDGEDEYQFLQSLVDQEIRTAAAGYSYLSHKDDIPSEAVQVPLLFTSDNELPLAGDASANADVDVMPVQSSDENLQYDQYMPAIEEADERKEDDDEADADTAYGRWYSYSSDEDSMAVRPGTDHNKSILDPDSDMENDPIEDDESSDGDFAMSPGSESRSTSVSYESSADSAASDDEDERSSGEEMDEEGDDHYDSPDSPTTDASPERKPIQRSLEKDDAGAVFLEPVEVNHLANLLATSADKENIDPREGELATSSRLASIFRYDPSGPLDVPVSSERTPVAPSNQDAAVLPLPTKASMLPALCDTSAQTEPVPPLDRTRSDDLGHLRTPSGSDISTEGPVTPPAPLNPRKRGLPHDFEETHMAESTPTKKTQVAKGVGVANAPSGARGIGSTIGLVLMGAAVGSAGTIWGLMQLAD